MDTTVGLHLSLLTLIVLAAVVVGLLIHRSHVRKAAAADTEESVSGDGMGGAIGYLGGAAAFLLGVLMLASLDHYNTTKTIVADEALAYSAAFDSTDGLPKADQPGIRRDLVCLMRSVATNSWSAAEAGDIAGSPNTHAWHRRASADAAGVDPQTKAQEHSLETLQSELIDASKSGQQRLLAANSDLPLALWILVFVSVFVLTAILVALLRAHPSRTLAIASLASVLVVSAAMVWTLTTFDEPFTKGDGVYISPQALEAVMVRLQGTYPEADWGPCETLVRQ